MNNGGKAFFFRILPLASVCACAFAQAPVIATGGTVNAADYTRTFAPGGLVAIFGSNFAASPAQPQQLPLPATLGGVSAQLVASGENLPLWYVSSGQINAQLPYDTPLGPVQVRVQTASGASNIDTITVTAAAPKIFTQNATGAGAGVVTNPSYQILTAGNPANPADTIVLWMNSLGATSGSPVAGQPSPGTANGSQPLTVSGVTAQVAGVPATVTFAGLSPGSSGLYQVNVQAPFITITGTVPVTITLGGVSSQASVTLPYQQLGFYFSLMGGKAVTGETLNGMSGTTSDLAFQQADQTTWGAVGFNAWTDNTGLGAPYSAVSGVAMTLYNGSAIVYDNNGIDSGTEGMFYNNTGGGADSQKPGLSDLFSMSNYFPLVFSGYFTLSASTTITQLNAYFDASGSTDLPFNPANPYVKYRMNIWSNATGPLPSETGNFTGNVFSSDTTAGTFSYAKTGVMMVSSIASNVPKPIYRLTYTLAAPLTLAAGQYWFSDDASVRATPAATSTSSVIGLDELHEIISAQHVSKGNVAHFSFFGQEMWFEESYGLPGVVTVKPAAIVEHR